MDELGLHPYVCELEKFLFGDEAGGGFGDDAEKYQSEKTEETEGLEGRGWAN